MKTEENKNEWSIQSRPFVNKKFDADCVIIADDEGYVFAVGGSTKEKAEANAKIIVKSVNHNQQLIDTLKNIIDAQRNPNKSLANLNSTIFNAEKLINKIEKKLVNNHKN
jgi:hypothetical protein